MRSCGVHVERTLTRTFISWYPFWQQSIIWYITVYLGKKSCNELNRWPFYVSVVVGNLFSKGGLSISKWAYYTNETCASIHVLVVANHEWIPL